MLKNNQKLKAFCDYPFRRLKFTPDGYVAMCCFHQRKCLGNILSKNLEEIWFSDLANEIRQETLKGNLHKTCQVETCPFFQKTNFEIQEFEASQFPEEFEIDVPAQHCNIGGERPTEKNPACLMCERHILSPDVFYQADFLEQVCAKLKPYIHHIKLLHIQGIAEPFWKDKIFEVLEWLDVPKYKKDILISTTTNGTLMNERHRRMFLDYPKTSITWSLDAGSPEIYRTIRRVNMYDRVVENLKNSCNERKENQWVQIHNNINTINLGDVANMIYLAHEAGVDRIDFNATYNVPSIGVNETNVHFFREAQKEIMVLSRQLGVFATFLRNLTLNITTPPSEEEINQEIANRPALKIKPKRRNPELIQIKF